MNIGKENLAKFDVKAYEGIFLGYSLNSYSYRIYNKRLMTVEESVHVVFDESNHEPQMSSKIGTCEEDLLGVFSKFNMNIPGNQVDSSDLATEQESHEDLAKEWRILRNLSLNNVIG